jgi:hypothetical protein
MAKKKAETKTATKKAAKKQVKKAVKKAAPEAKDDLQGTDAEREARAQEAAAEALKNGPGEEETDAPEVEKLEPTGDRISDMVLGFISTSGERLKSAKKKKTESRMVTSLAGRPVVVTVSVEAK